MNDVAIRVENLSKYYRLGVINNGTLFRDIQSWWARKKGKEDPHAKIGDNYDSSVEGFWALKDLNFEIKKGDRVGIIGYNGAGKSTLLKLLSGITVPTEGTIKINGRISSLLEVGTGFHPEMTGRENVYLNGSILGMKKSEIDKKIDEIIEFSEIKDYIDTPVKRYSSGMYVRLAFAVAAHLDSDILIADEVLAVGDAAFQKKAIGKMNDLSAGEGRTVLFVSHNITHVKNLCNKGIVLEKGLVKAIGDLNECINFYEDEIRLKYRTLILDENDTKLKRGNGSVEFTDIVFSKNSYFDDEPINIKIQIKVNKKILGLYFRLYFKNESNGINVAEIFHCLKKENIDAGYILEFELDITAGQLVQGRYPLYFWLGDEDSLMAETPHDFCVLDEFTPDLIIKKKKNTYGASSLVRLNSELNILG